MGFKNRALTLIVLSPSLSQHVLDTQASSTPKGVVARLQTELEQLQQQLKNNQNNNSEVENGQNQQKQDPNLGNQVAVLEAKVEELENLLTSKAEAMGLLQGRIDILQQVINNCCLTAARKTCSSEPWRLSDPEFSACVRHSCHVFQPLCRTSSLLHSIRVSHRLSEF